MTSIRARFRTHEKAMQVYRLLEPVVGNLDPPERTDDSGWPWVLVISFTEMQQEVVLSTVRLHEGVTFQETV